MPNDSVAEFDNAMKSPAKWAFNLEKPAQGQHLKKEHSKPAFDYAPIKTGIEELMTIVVQKKKASVKEIASSLGWSQKQVEEVAKVLEKQGVVDVVYPASVISSPSVVLLKELQIEPQEKVDGLVLQQYDFFADFIPVHATLFKSRKENSTIYEIKTPFVGPYTHAFLEQLREEIAEKIPVELAEITDEKKSIQLKEKFFNVSKQELQAHIPGIDEKNLNLLAGRLLHSMYGLGRIELLMADNSLEEIAINSSKTPVTVYHRVFGWASSNIYLESEEKIANFASQIGRKVGREITTLNPILDAHLITGDRVNATLFPVSSSGNTITIRRFSRRPWTIVDFIGEKHTMSIEMAALLWMAMHYEMSVLIAGGTASGKTSTLNSLCAFIPAYHRIISIEDVREIMLPSYMRWNWVPLTTRNPNPEGLGEVGMLDLLHSSLRMRPDRIILGEMRRQREAEVLFEAMHTGHSVYSTIHADSGQQVLRRLIEPPINVPPLEVEALDLILVQFRDRRTNLRRTYEIAELESGVSAEQLAVNTIYRWRPREDDWDKVNEPSKLIQNLNLHTGLTQKEIGEDVFSRAKILEWMLDNRISEMDQVGAIMRLFYSEPDSIMAAAEKGVSPKRFLGLEQ